MTKIAALLKTLAPSFAVRQEGRIEWTRLNALAATQKYVRYVEDGEVGDLRRDLLFEMQKANAAYFKLVDREVLNSGKLSGAAFDRWQQDWTKSASKVLDGAITYLKLLRNERSKLSLGGSIFEPTQGTLRNLQAFLAATAPVDAMALKAKYTTEELPGTGFDAPYCPQSAEPMKPPVTVAVSSGIVFLIAILLIAIFFPDPTNFQYTVFRIILALAAAAFATVIPGIIEVNINKMLKATGALAVFVIVYFYSPANLVVQPGDKQADPPTAGQNG